MTLAGPSVSAYIDLGRKFRFLMCFLSSSGLFNLPGRNGKLKKTSIERFDNEFFELPDKHVLYADPQVRMFLELTYEVLVDAGELT